MTSKYLEFAKQPKRRTQKTWITDVTSLSGGMLLGQIKWYGAWRQYAFYPSTDKVTIFNMECMNDICEVIRELMDERGQTRPILDATKGPPKTKGEIGFDNYANLVAEVYGIEGQQIKPNDPRLTLPDKRCPECVATMGEPKPLSPVRRQVHEKLQTGWHFPDCPTTLGKSWHDTKEEES